MQRTLLPLSFVVAAPPGAAAPDPSGDVLLHRDNRADHCSQRGRNIAPRTTPVGVDFPMLDFASVVSRTRQGADVPHVTGMDVVSDADGHVTGGGDASHLNAIHVASSMPKPGSAALVLAGAGLPWGRGQLRRMKRQARETIAKPPRVWGTWVALACAWALAGSAQAALLDRGGGMIYDTTRDVTWLADMDLAFTSGYAAANVGRSGLAVIESDGQMNWYAAVAWADQLVYGGFSDWRLPTLDAADASCTGGIAGAGYNCTGGELSGLFVGDLGYNDGPLLTAADDTPEQTANLALFSHIQAGEYWSGTEWGSGASGGTGLASYFSTSLGYQSHDFLFSAKHVVAVRPGDVTLAVPEPQTLALTLLALGATLATRTKPRSLRPSGRRFLSVWYVVRAWALPSLGKSHSRRPKEHGLPSPLEQQQTACSQRLQVSVHASSAGQCGWRR